MDNRDRAIENFKTMNCHQAVLTTLGTDYGLTEMQCLSIGMSFGGGMAKQGKTCGAVTSAYVVIGIWSAKQHTDLQEQKKLAAEKVKEFNLLFNNKHKGLDCKELLNFDLSKQNEAEKAEKLGLFDSLCPKFVAGSVEILEGILKS